MTLCHILPERRGWVNRIILKEPMKIKSDIIAWRSHLASNYSCNQCNFFSAIFFSQTAFYASVFWYLYSSLKNKFIFLFLHLSLITTYTHTHTNLFVDLLILKYFFLSLNLQQNFYIYIYIYIGWALKLGIHWLPHTLKHKALLMNWAPQYLITYM